MLPWLTETKDGVTLEVLVQPRASRTKIVGAHDGRLKIALAAPPVDGEANAVLIAFIAERLGVKKNEVTLISGQTSRRKRLAVRTMPLEEVAVKMAAP